jgi:adenylyltransferase/sulfurtransferase
MPVIPGRTACLACVFPAPPAGELDTCDTAGILLSAIAAVSAFQVADAIKILSGRVVPEARLLSLDVWKGSVRAIHTGGPVEGCAVCGSKQFLHLSGENRPVITMCGRNSVQIHERNRPVDLAEIGRRLSTLGAVRANRFALQFAPRESQTQITLFPDGRAIIKGTSDPGTARSLYARYIGN